jgi:hypothetical protein
MPRYWRSPRLLLPGAANCERRVLAVAPALDRYQRRYLGGVEPREDCLQRAIKEVRAEEELKLDPCVDRDTTGVPGSPDIAATIFEKIKAADIFVGDVSFINQGATGRPTPNPNVLVELG